MHKTYFNWSSGKDSSLALFYMLQQEQYNISTLLTTVNEDYKRVSMHGVREDLLDAQANSLQIPLQKIRLPAEVSMKSYNEAMSLVTSELKKQKYTHCVFGDIFLEDLRQYREQQLENIGIKAVFPLWKKNTTELVLEFISLGFKAITVCVNAKYLDQTFCGRILDADFIKDLPSHVDPCGENGEFHTFVFDGPIFSFPISFAIGEKVQRTYAPSKDKDNDCFTDEEHSNWNTSFWYCDLIPN